MNPSNKKYLMHPSLYAQKKAQETTNIQAANQSQELPAGQQSNQLPQASTPQNDQRPVERRTSDVNKAFDADSVRKFPRPLILTAESKVRQIHDIGAFEDLPKNYYEYDAPDSGNATCRFARSSMYLVPENAGAFTKSGYKFSIIYTPLAEPGDNDLAVPLADKRESAILRCERCQCFVNPSFIFRDNWDKYTCNICEMEGKVPANYIDRINPQPESHPETQFGVYDFLVPDSYCFTDVKGHDILLCFDMSYESLVNGSFFHVLANLTVFLESLEEDVSLGFLLFDSVVSFFRVTDEGDGDEIGFVRCVDSDSPASLPRSELFLNAKRDKTRIEKLIAFLQAFAEKQYNEKHNEIKNTAHDLEALGRTLEDCFKANPGHVIIFTSTFKKTGTEVVKYKDTDKVPLLKTKNPSFTKIAESLAQKFVTVDLFVTTDKQVELSTISELSTKTGGQVFYFSNFRSAADSEKLYYELYRTLTAFRTFDVACRLRVSSGLQILSYQTPRGKLFTLDFQLSSLTSDQHIIADLQLGENLKDKKNVHAQFVVLFTNTFGIRTLRVINLSLKVTPDMALFFKNLDCDAFSYVFMRDYAEKLSQKPAAEVSDEALKAAYKLFRFYRYDIGGRYEPREFALPDKIKFFPLFLSSFLSRPCFNSKSAVNNADYNFFSMLSLTQSHLTKLVFNLYPKMFDLSRLFTDIKNGVSEVVEVEEGQQIALPDSIPANLILIKSEGVYLGDNGDMLYINVRAGANEQLLEELFGVQAFSQLETPCPLPALDTEFSRIVNAIVARLRGIKTGSVQPTLVVAENDDNTYRLRNLFVEDCNTVVSSHYWDFLSQLHEKVKDD